MTHPGSGFESQHPRQPGGKFAPFQRSESALTLGGQTRDPRGESEWSRRAIINVVEVLGEHTDALTLIGGHGVHIRTVALDVDILPTSDGDLAITPGLVSDNPRIETLLLQAGYEHRTEARPGLWGRTPYLDRNGTRQYREKIDLSAARALSGTTSIKKWSVPAISVNHGKLTVNNTSGLELSSFDRSVELIEDYTDPDRSVEVHVAGGSALLIAKAYKVSERLANERQGPVRAKDLGDIWRLMASTETEQAVETFRRFSSHDQIGPSVVLGATHLRQIATDPKCQQLASDAFGDFVDPNRIFNDFADWSEALALLR